MSCTAMTLAAVLLTAGEGDWTQWRGPDRDGISKETGWSSAGREEDLWAADVGLGYSCVSIRGERLYTLGHDKEKKLDMVLCLDAETGKPLWTHTFAASLMAKMHGGGTLTTPSVEGDRVFVLNREGKFFCLDAGTGEVKWFKQVTQTLDVKPPQWGFASSPLVLPEAVIINVGRVVAIDRKTGAVRWSTRDYGAGYCTPIDYETDGQTRIAVMCGEGLVVVDRPSGRELFVYPWKTDWNVNAASPIVLGGNKLFISSGYNHGCALIDTSGDAPKVVWENRNMRNKMATSVHWKGHFYGFDESVLKCLDDAGSEKWRERGTGMGALMLADDRIIYVTGRGELVVAAADAEAYRELSRAKVLDGGVYWTAPVLSRGRIYVRSSKGRLACRDHRPKGTNAGE